MNCGLACANKQAIKQPHSKTGSGNLSLTSRRLGSFQNIRPNPTEIVTPLDQNSFRGADAWFRMASGGPPPWATRRRPYPTPATTPPSFLHFKGLTYSYLL